MKCYFNWDIDYKDARQEVINRLQFVPLPPGVQPQLSPWNAIGEVFRYRVVGKGYSLKDLKTAEDWILERQFKQVPGVIDVVELRRRDEAVPRRGRPLSPARAGRDAQAAHRRDRQRQPERRRPAHHASASSRTTCAASASSRSPRDIEQHRRRRAEGHRRCACATSARRAASATRRASASSATTASPTSCRASSSCATAARRADARRRARARRLHPQRPPAAAGHGHRALLRSRRARRS